MSETKNILFLGSPNSPVLQWLRNNNEKTINTIEKITIDFLKENNIGFIISYGYRHLIKKDVLNYLPNAVINLHISFLPFNRGADPNFWSFIDNSPKGVTIHYIDEGLDTGDIIVQKETKIDSKIDTLSTSYAKLHYDIQNLFYENWEAIKKGEILGKIQIGPGSKHYSKNKNKLLHLLDQNGWDTKVAILENYLSSEEE